MMGSGEVIPAGDTPAVFRSRLWHASSRSSEYPGAIFNPFITIVVVVMMMVIMMIMIIIMADVTVVVF